MAHVLQLLAQPLPSAQDFKRIRPLALKQGICFEGLHVDYGFFLPLVLHVF
jgi:hypothetical protein